MVTITVPLVLTSPRDDAMQLYRAFKGFGCDTAAKITKRLSSELSGDVKKAVLLWLPDPATRDATILRDALSGDVIDLKAATEVICSRTQAQIQQVKQIYHALFGVYLENDIELQAKDDHKKLLLAYVSAIRYEGPEVDRGMADQDAKHLYKAGEKKLGTDEKAFIRIFSERSCSHLLAVNASYRNMYGNSLKKAIKSETSGLFEFGLLSILQSAENPAKFFAKRLHKAMEGMGTNDTTLIRIIVTRAEIDMQYIKAEYHKKHRKSLNDAVHKETSGNYRSFLLSLLGPNHP
ncbi:calcium-binding protein [Lithospermum erythrorhizon]|uniref:Annexin n=1 Tax=Lithospermum erythrorhizon TaxID=34254 RepID=A0AAV3PG96_LITER